MNAMRSGQIQGSSKGEDVFLFLERSDTLPSVKFHKRCHSLILDPCRCDTLQGNCQQEGFVYNILPPDKRNQHRPTHVQHVAIRSRFGVQETDALLISSMLHWILYTLSENVIHREPQACPRACGISSGRENSVSSNVQIKDIFIYWERSGWLENNPVLSSCLWGGKPNWKDCHMQPQWHLFEPHLTELLLDILYLA